MDDSTGPNCKRKRTQNTQNKRNNTEYTNGMTYNCTESMKNQQLGSVAVTTASMLGPSSSSSVRSIQLSGTMERQIKDQTDELATFTELKQAMIQKNLDYLKVTNNIQQTLNEKCEDIEDLRHESLNHLLKNNIEIMKNHSIDLKPLNIERLTDDDNNNHINHTMIDQVHVTNNLANNNNDNEMVKNVDNQFTVQYMSAEQKVSDFFVMNFSSLHFIWRF